MCRDLLRGQRWGLTKAEALGWRDHDPDSTLPNHESIIRIPRVWTAESASLVWGGVNISGLCLNCWFAGPFLPRGSSQSTAPARGLGCSQ